MSFPADFILGVTASVVANVIGGLPTDQAGKLTGEYRKALDIASHKLAQQKPQYFDLPSQVDSFLARRQIILNRS